MLKLAENLELPLDAVTRTFGLLAVRGAGKSNTAAVMAEEMFKAKLPFVVIDPVGSWYGLRSSSDGTAPGLPIPIFGGKHGDVPLERGAGELVADLVVDQRLSCVLDLSRFESEAGKKDFLLAFAKRLYLRNEDPLHLFLEEADDFIPQKPMRDEAQLLRAWENIVRRGRSRGLGVTLITQRSAAIAKMVLTQVETLFAMRTTGPQDIASIEAWIKYHQVDNTVLASLAGLEDGEAWVWSPHYLKTLKRVRIRRRHTFDSGATPKNVKGTDGRPAATLADVDLAALEKRMAATIEKSKAEDPKELRKTIAAQKAELAKLSQSSNRVAKPEVKVIEKPVITDAQLARAEGVLKRIEILGGRLTVLAGTVADAITKTRQPMAPAEHPHADRATGDGRGRPTAPQSPSSNGRLSTRTHRPDSGDAPHGRSGSPPAAGSLSAGNVELDGPQRAILDTVAMLDARNIRPTRDTVARWLDIHPNGGRYGSNLARLREAGYLDGFELTATGATHCRRMPTGLTGAMAPLDGSQRELVDMLDHTRMVRYTRDTLAQALGIHPNGGRYGSNLARLRTMGLIPERGEIYLTEAAYL